MSYDTLKNVAQTHSITSKANQLKQYTYQCLYTACVQCILIRLLFESYYQVAPDASGTICTLVAVSRLSVIFIYIVQLHLFIITPNGLANKVWLIEM